MNPGISRKISETSAICSVGASRKRACRYTPADPRAKIRDLWHLPEL